MSTGASLPDTPGHSRERGNRPHIICPHSYRLTSQGMIMSKMLNLFILLPFFRCQDSTPGNRSSCQIRHAWFLPSWSILIQLCSAWFCYRLKSAVFRACSLRAKVTQLAPKIKLITSSLANDFSKVLNFAFHFQFILGMLKTFTKYLQNISALCPAKGLKFASEYVEYY